MLFLVWATSLTTVTTRWENRYAYLSSSAITRSQIYKRFGELGGKSICELGLGDDEDNIENDFLVWKKQFRPVACKGSRICC